MFHVHILMCDGKSHQLKCDRIHGDGTYVQFVDIYGRTIAMFDNTYVAKVIATPM